MKDYRDTMTVEEARTFSDDVLNIVAQIPASSLWCWHLLSSVLRRFAAVLNV